MKQNKNLKNPIEIHNPETPTTILNTGWQKNIEIVQGVVDAYHAIHDLPKLQSEELQALFKDTEIFLYDKLTGGSLHLVSGNGHKFSIDKKQAFALLSEKPKGLNELLQMVKDAEVLAKTPTINTTEIGISDNGAFSIYNIDKYFVLNADGIVTLNEETKERFSKAGNVYIKTEKGTAVKSFADAVVKAFFECGLHEYFPQDETSTVPDLYGKLSGKKLAFIVAKTIRSIDYKSYSPKYLLSNGRFFGDAEEHRLKSVDVD